MYTANGVRDLFCIIFIKNLIAMQPETKAAATPTSKAATFTFCNAPVVAHSTPSNSADPAIMGIASRKLNSAADDLFIPHILIAAMVEPLRDMPGRTAIP